MFAFQALKRWRLPWVGLAFLLHAALLVALPKRDVAAVPVPLPVEVSLLDPAPVEAPPEAPAAPEPPVPAKPLPPITRAPTKPLVQPKPTPRQETVPDPMPTTQSTDVAASSSVEPEPSAPDLPPHGNEPAKLPGQGEKLVAASFDAAYLRNPRPEYPPMSRKLREEGKVMLRVHVRRDGSPEGIQIKRSSGSARLDEAAKAAVSRWRFIPARRGSEAVTAWVVVPIIFNLES